MGFEPPTTTLRRGQRLKPLVHRSSSLITFLNIFVNSVSRTETFSNQASLLTKDEMAHLSNKYQPLFSGGEAANLSSGEKLGRILNNLEERLNLGSIVPEASKLDDDLEILKKCYSFELLSEHAKDSVNPFNSTLKEVIKKFFVSTILTLLVTILTFLIFKNQGH